MLRKHFTHSRLDERVDRNAVRELRGVLPAGNVLVLDHPSVIRCNEKPIVPIDNGEELPIQAYKLKLHLKKHSLG